MHHCSKCGKEVPSGSEFCLHCGANLTASSRRYATEGPHPSRSGIGVLALVVGMVLIVGLIVVGLIIAYVSNESSKRNTGISRPSVLAQNNPVIQPERVSIVDKTFPVAAQQYVYYTIPLKAGNLTHVTGHFTAQGGSNDIEVLLLDQDGFTNFSNGHNANTYYNSGGYVTTGSIDLNLRPGIYYVVFNNARAMLTNKVVTAKIDAE